MYIKDEDYKKWVRKKEFKASDFDLDIIYEDENIIIIDKKSGVYLMLPIKMIMEII
ncbi:MAG: hypothetical protein ACLTA5_08730 [Anaerococcus obesiensis]